MSRAATPAAVALALAGLLAAGATPTGAQDDTAKATVLDVRAKVLDLERKVTSQGGDVARTDAGREVRVALATDVLFAFGSAELGAKARRVLEEAAKTLDDEARGRVLVVGHTDNRGGTAYNQRLSVRRARAVQAELEDLIDAAEVDLVARGRGESQPTAPNEKENGRDNPEGRRLNRRVEVRFRR